MSRKSKHQPGDIYPCPRSGGYVRMDEHGEEQPFKPHPYNMFPDPPAPDPLDDIPWRADGSIAPYYDLTHDEMERLGEDTPRTVRNRHDGWTLERQKHFIETLAATASISEACRFVGLSRQSAHKLYRRSPQFRAAWDEALKAAVGVLAATAFDRAVNGTQEQVFYKGRMVGFREKHHDRLLIHLLRVRDPLNYAPLDDLQGWQRHRALEAPAAGIEPMLDRLEAAERAWETAHREPPQLSAPEDRVDQALEPLADLPEALAAAPGAALPAPAAAGAAAAKHPLTLSTSSTWSAETARGTERSKREPSGGEETMSGPRRDSSDGTRGGPLHGRGGKSVDDNKKSGGGHGKPAGQTDDSNAHPPGGGVS